MDSFARLSDLTPPVLILGATGQLGQCLLPAILAKGHSILAVSRQVPNDIRAGLIWIQQDLDLEPLRTQAQTLISAGPLALALKQARANTGLRRIIAFSSASVHFKQHSKDPDERALIQSLTESENQLQHLSDQRGIDLTLLRPTMIYGGRSDANISVIRAVVRKRSFIPSSGNGLRQPVHVDDLAELTAELMDRRGHGVEQFDLGGGETLAYREFIQRIAASENRTTRLLPVPSLLVNIGLGLAHRLGRLQSIRPVMVERQQVDLIVNDDPARERLGWKPRSFQP